MSRRRKVLAVAIVLFAAALVLAGCGTAKLSEPFKDAERGQTNSGPADTVTFPDGFSNVSTKCSFGNRVYVAYHGDSPYASVAVVPADPSCATGGGPVTTTTLRDQDLIVSRIEAVKAEDFFGFAREVLIGALDFEHAKPFLKPEVTADQWDTPTVDSLTRQAVEYLEFAYGKALDHRGISAGRSVDKLREYAWLLGRDDVVGEMDSASYENYGAPKLKAFAEGMGLPVSDDPQFLRMASGDTCSPGCESGCST